MCRAFAARLEEWERSGFEPVRRAWLARAYALGRDMEARLPSETVMGTFEDIDTDGCLLLRLENGQLRRVSAGDVHFSS